MINATVEVVKNIKTAAWKKTKKEKEQTEK